MISKSKRFKLYKVKSKKLINILKEPMTIVQIDHSGRHNIFVTARKNRSLFAVSTGRAGFSGTRRKSAFSAEMLGWLANRKLRRKKTKNIQVVFTSRISYFTRAVFAGLVKTDNFKIRNINISIKRPHGDRLRKRHLKRK